jgi:hypothetical protein
VAAAEATAVAAEAATPTARNASLSSPFRAAAVAFAAALSVLWSGRTAGPGSAGDAGRGLSPLMLLLLETEAVEAEAMLKTTYDDVEVYREELLLASSSSSSSASASVRLDLVSIDWRRIMWSS